MPRDPGLEEFVRDTLGGVPGLTEKALFDGWAFLLNGNSLCGCRLNRLLLRMGPEHEGWALAIFGVSPVVMGGRSRRGYVQASAEAYGDDTVRQRLLDAAVGFMGSLPGE